MTSSEPHTPSEDELVRTYVEHLGPITLGTEFERQQEVRRGLNKIKSGALREAAKALPKPVGLNCNAECHSVDWASLHLRADRIEEEA